MALRIPRLRYIRHSLASITGSKRRRLVAWLAARATAFSGTGTATDLDGITALDINIVSHPYTTGDGPFVFTTAGTLPSGLDEETLYWVSSVDDDNLNLHLSQDDAVTGSNIVNPGGAGTGQHTLNPAATSQAVLEHLRLGTPAGTLQAETDVDNLVT